MFSSVGLFQQVQCPKGLQCQLPSCFFLHHTQNDATRSTTSTIEIHLGNIECSVPERPHKRQRTDDGHDPAHVVAALVSRSSSNASCVTDDPPQLPKPSTSKHTASETLLPSVRKDVSPPPLRKHLTPDGKDSAGTKPFIPSAKVAASTKAKLVESLNPRMLKKSPAAHSVRLKLLMLLYEQTVRLNKEVIACDDPSKDALELSQQELITEALDEEYRAARDNPIVYANVLKLRIVSLKKMKLAEWKQERLKQIAKDFPEAAPPKASTLPVTIATGLLPIEEISLLPKLVASQEGVSKYGYVVTPPSELEVEQARKGVEASQGWEQCDRCKSRFQVFPGRRPEDGALTSGGRCTYHYGKPRRPMKEKADTGHKDTVYSCCSQDLGTSGCTTAESHVFKVSEAKRLALIMPFKKTETRGPSPPNHAVCFDCEMGYTTLGLELIRLTATSWPDGGQLLDVLVRPLGEVLCLNSRFSGVWPVDYSNAIPYAPGYMHDHTKDEGPSARKRLLLVNTPAEARDLLLDHLTTTTPLIGHALENDLCSARIIHPAIVDTVLLYPHPRGLPIRHGLKMLVKKYLNKDIQIGGAQGHDSKEDALASGELVRLKVMELWKSMKAEGWLVREGEFYPPPHES